MDINKLQRKEYYENNKERIKEQNKQYYHDNKIVRQQYNRNYWATHGHKYVEQRKNTVNDKKKYMKHIEYHTEYSKQIVERKDEECVKTNENKSVIVYFN